MKRSVPIPPEGGTTNEQARQSTLHAVQTDVLVPRLLPREIVAGGRSLQCSAFQGWSPGTRIDSLIPSRVEYNMMNQKTVDSFPLTLALSPVENL